MSLSYDNSLVCTLGSPNVERGWKYAAVIQGPSYKVFGSHNLPTLLSRNPDTLIICSTYLPDDETHGLTKPGSSLHPFIKSILFDDGSLEGGVPDGELRKNYRERLIFLFVRVPERDNKYFWNLNRHNQNLQRLSSYIGLEYARRMGVQFVAKSRQDIFIGRYSFCSYLEPYSLHPLLIPDGETPKITGRLVFLDIYTKTRNMGHAHFGNFHMGDLLVFGHASDVCSYFDIAAINEQKVSATWISPSGSCYEMYPENNFSSPWIEQTGVTKFPTSEGETPFFMRTFEFLARYGALVDAYEELGFLWPERYWYNNYEDIECYLRMTPNSYEQMSDEDLSKVIAYLKDKKKWLPQKDVTKSWRWRKMYDIVLEKDKRQNIPLSIPRLYDTYAVDQTDVIFLPE